MPAREPGGGGNETIEAGTLTIEVEQQSPVQVVRLRGELGMNEAPALEAQLRRALDSGPSGYEIDMSGLAFIDSTGLACLLRAVRDAGERGAEPPRFRGATGHVLRVLRMTSVDRTLRIAK
jgi:anti-anti-sigma factor